MTGGPWSATLTDTDVGTTLAWADGLIDSIGDLGRWLAEYRLADLASDTGLQHAVSQIAAFRQRAAGRTELDPELLTALITLRVTARENVGQVGMHVRAVLANRQGLLKARAADLAALEAKNHKLAERLIDRARRENATIEAAGRRLNGLIAVMGKRRAQVTELIGPHALQSEVDRVQRAVLEAGAAAQAKQLLTQFCAFVGGRIRDSTAHLNEIHAMVAALYLAFRSQHAFREKPPAMFEDARYLRELENLQETCGREFDLAFSSRFGRRAATGAAFANLGARAGYLFQIANDEAGGWIAGITAPLEAHVLELQTGLRHCLSNLKKVYRGIAELDREIARGAPMDAEVVERLMELGYLEAALSRSLAVSPPEDIAERTAKTDPLRIAEGNV
jgi:hypothetical protein